MGEAWYHRWVPNWPWGRPSALFDGSTSWHRGMAFLPQALRLLSVESCAAAQGLRWAMNYAGRS